MKNLWKGLSFALWLGLTPIIATTGCASKFMAGPEYKFGNKKSIETTIKDSVTYRIEGPKKEFNDFYIKKTGNESYDLAFCHAPRKIIENWSVNPPRIDLEEAYELVSTGIPTFNYSIPEEYRKWNIVESKGNTITTAHPHPDTIIGHLKKELFPKKFYYLIPVGESKPESDAEEEKARKKGNGPEYFIDSSQEEFLNFFVAEADEPNTPFEERKVKVVINQSTGKVAISVAEGFYRGKKVDEERLLEINEFNSEQ
ncbi:hypothetical protein J4474_05105 [Candidatus Pacearchaeota archaeon]|nr:hypothetical protein [Candidatus Pacearchaeota archaeon]